MLVMVRYKSAANDGWLFKWLRVKNEAAAINLVKWLDKTAREISVVRKDGV